MVENNTITRIMALDVGDKRIGVALSDPLHISAGVLDIIERTGNKEDLEKIASLVELYSVSRLVIGLPLNLKGRETSQTLKVKEFGNELENRLEGTKIIYENEQYTSKRAEKVLIKGNVSRKKRKKYQDSLAAVLILQVYLDRIRQTATF